MVGVGSCTRILVCLRGNLTNLEAGNFLTLEGLHAYHLVFWWGTPTDLGNILAFPSLDVSGLTYFKTGFSTRQEFNNGLERVGINGINEQEEADCSRVLILSHPGL